MYMSVMTYVKGFAQYSENMVEMMFATMLSFVRSVAVMSMKMLRVLRVILLCSELIIGGMDKTLSFVS